MKAVKSSKPATIKARKSADPPKAAAKAKTSNSDDSQASPRSPKSAKSAKHKLWMRIGRIALGLGFLILGIIGLILPLVPQIPFLLAAALLLAPDFPPARRLINWVFRRWPKLRGKVPKKLRRLTKKGAE